MEPERIPKHLGEAVKFIEELRRIARISGRSIKELCLKYVLFINGIDSIVVGINSIEQIKENIKVFDSRPLKKETIKAIDRIPIPPEYILNPGMWGELKKLDLVISLMLIFLAYKYKIMLIILKTFSNYSIFKLTNFNDKE